MGKNNKLKLFISYSHEDNKEDNKFINEFKKHTTLLKKNGLIEDWYDREIFAGDDFQKEIDNNLEDADIICLFISANFIYSPECQKEQKAALELEIEKGISVIPIILSPCEWSDDKELSKKLAIPTDGQPVTTFDNQNKAWKDVYDNLKRVIERDILVRNIQVQDEFIRFLNDTEYFSKLHSQKKQILLDDIYIHPELDTYDEFREYQKRISADELIDNILKYSRILIAGEDQSSKTTLCKIIFKELRKKNFIPIYIQDKTNKLRGVMDGIIKRNYHEQYEGVPFDDISRDKIIPIIDDFHFALKKEKKISSLAKYQRVIVIVDDIFCLNFEDGALVKSFSSFKINELKSSLRYKLIKNWSLLTDKTDEPPPTENVMYKTIDKNTELINSSLGKIIGSGIMPAYPFFILSIVSTYETFSKPIEQEITSQGHCYQALIYLFLRKQNVRNEHVDTYINFLTELASYIYSSEKDELTEDEFIEFIKQYSEIYHLPISKNIILKKLQGVKIITIDSFMNYSFTHSYLYYYFVGKYFADHLDEKKGEIIKILKNLHVNEYAYISVFISHHSRSHFILDEIIKIAGKYFKDIQPATLKKKELSFFDDRLEDIVEAILPARISPEEERAKLLAIDDEIEEMQKEEESSTESVELEEVEIRGSIKTVEVMGQIIKNRAGSLERDKLEEIVFEGMNVHLRLLTAIFEVIKNPDEQQFLIKMIKDKLDELSENGDEFGREELEENARKIFWNINFIFIFGVINKIIHSLGSDQLDEIIEKVCKEVDTPASLLIMNGTIMWYKKSIRFNEMKKLMDKQDNSDIAKRIMQFMIILHCSLHKINYRDMQRVRQTFNIPRRKLLPKKDDS